MNGERSGIRLQRSRLIGKRSVMQMLIPLTLPKASPMLTQRTLMLSEAALRDVNRARIDPNNRHPTDHVLDIRRNVPPIRTNGERTDLERERAGFRGHETVLRDHETVLTDYESAFTDYQSVLTDAGSVLSSDDTSIRARFSVFRNVTCKTT
jgi:hypothetical protein